MEALAYLSVFVIGFAFGALYQELRQSSGVSEGK